jgi:hypothetical protein
MFLVHHGIENFCWQGFPVAVGHALEMVNGTMALENRHGIESRPLELTDDTARVNEIFIRLCIRSPLKDGEPLGRNKITIET